MKQMGKNLRNHYTNTLRFLSQDPNPSETHIRSTDFARTLESVQYLLSGLYPNSGASLEVHIHHQETMYPDYAECESLRKLSKEFRRAQVSYMVQLASPIIDKLKKESIQIELNSKGIHTLFDTLVCMDAHGVKLPPSMTMSDLKTLEKACVQYWWQVYHDVDRIGRLSIGRFLKELLSDTDSMVNELCHAKKLIIHSGHDS
jgi:acid phosphatase